MFQDVSSELLRLGYGIRFCPAGHSMHPTIKDGEAVMVAPLAASATRRGDILLYRNERGGLTAHRVVRIERDSAGALRLILRGDASADCDAPVTEEQLLGRVVSVERDRRKLILVGRRAGLHQMMRRTAAQLRRLVKPALKLWERRQGQLPKN